MSVFTWPARVYWEDTDGGGIVYYANYLRFLERARTEWLRSLGHSQSALVEEQGVVFTVVSLEAEYRRPARLDDELTITCEPQVEGAASVRFRQRIFRGRGEPDSARLLLQASVRVACLDAHSLRPKRLPEFVLRSTIDRAPPRRRSSRSHVE